MDFTGLMNLATSAAQYRMNTLQANRDAANARLLAAQAVNNAQPQNQPTTLYTAPPASVVAAAATTQQQQQQQQQQQKSNTTTYALIGGGVVLAALVLFITVK